MKIKSILFVLLVGMFSFGECAEYTSVAIPSNNPNSQLNIKFTPTDLITGIDMNHDISQMFDNGYEGFILEIENNYDLDIELDWNKVVFIENGNSNGGFMFQGILYAQRNDLKPTDVILAKSTFSKKIFPNNRIRANSSATAWNQWMHNRMREGKYGIYLPLVVNGEKNVYKLFVEIKKEKQGKDVGEN